MLIYSANARRVVAINGNMMAPARATIEHYRSLGLKLVPYSGLLAAGVPAAFDALVTALVRVWHHVAGAMSSSRRSRSRRKVFRCTSGSRAKSRRKWIRRMRERARSIRVFAKKFTHRMALDRRASTCPMARSRRSARSSRIHRWRNFSPGCSMRKRRRKIAGARRRCARRRIVFIAAISRSTSCAWSDANGGLLQASDLAAFKTRIETPVSAEYRGTTVYKCGPWSQGPVFLQQLKILEGFDLAAMGHNSADYIHTVIEEREARIRRSRGLLRRSGIRRCADQGAGVEGVWRSARAH